MDDGMGKTRKLIAAVFWGAIVLAGGAVMVLGSIELVRGAGGC